MATEINQGMLAKPKWEGPPNASVVIHRTEPEAPTVDIETGISASGKEFFTVKVRNADNPDEAVTMAMAARYELDAMMARDKDALDYIAALFLNPPDEWSTSDMLNAIKRQVGDIGRKVESGEIPF